MKTLTGFEIDSVSGGANIDLAKEVILGSLGTVGGGLIGAAAMDSPGMFNIGPLIGAPIGGFVGFICGSVAALFFSNFDVSVGVKSL
jgi:hypothetical protein